MRTDDKKQGEAALHREAHQRRRETGFDREVRAAPERCNTAGNKAGCNAADLVQEGSRKSRIGSRLIAIPGELTRWCFGEVVCNLSHKHLTADHKTMIGKHSRNIGQS
ncbi:hypothetical protein [Sphingopyxis sp. BSNA05]|uniref:hypothetical protein n=1 Tax=Sphingopyxis sp. BSNA05 TaxID=1236614 RepID=UPI001564E9E0|nr:hypothetical protein [Sphingopyxis sp. BSNA05]